jgi:hypothetical protein
MESKELITIEEIIKGKIEFNFGKIQQALINRNFQPLSIKESSKLLKIVEKHYSKSLKSIDDISERKIRIREIEQTIENIENPAYWNFGTPFENKATDSLSHFCLASGEVLRNVLEKPIVTEKGTIKIPKPHTKGLNQMETAVFFNLLQRRQVIHPEITKKDLAQLITFLTGYATSDMTNSLSVNLNDLSIENPKFLPQLKRKLTAFISEL